MGAEIDRLEIEIEAAAAKANKELDKLVSRLEKISGSLSKIDTKKLSGFSAGLGQYTSKTSSASRETDHISKSFSNLSKKITGSKKSFSQMAGSFYANAFPIIRGMKKLKSSIESSMDYVETYNYFSVTMGKIGRESGKNFDKYGYESADAYVNSFKNRMNDLTRKMTGYNVGSNGELFMTDSIGLGLDPQTIQNYQASISAITNSVGLIGENSVNASKALTMLSADMSSLKNVDISTAMTNFQSGLIGQSRALYKYGIDITNATLQTYAYDLGLSKSVSEMTQAEKMQLRLIAILDQSKVAWGDQARTINSVANQYRILKQQVSNLARVIGNLFLPIVQKVLPVVNGLVIALQRLFTALGFKLWGGNWLKDTMDGISGVGGDSLGDLSDSVDDTTDGLKDASKAAEKLKTMVRGIDELNIIRPDDSSSTGSGVGNIGGDIDLSDAIGAALAEYESVWEEAFKNAENKAQEFADKICSIFNRIWEAIEPFRNSLKKLWDEGLSLLMGYTFQNLLDFYNLFLVPIGKWAFGTEDSGLTRFVNIVNERLMQIDWVWISDNLRKFWIAIEPFAEQFGEGLIDFFEDISKIPVGIINKLFGRNGAITGITDWLNNNDSEKARKWGYALGTLAIGIMALKGVGSIISKIAGIGTKLAVIVSGFSAIFGASGIIASMASQVTKLFAPFTSGGVVFEALGSIGIKLSILLESLTGFTLPVGASMVIAATAFTALAAGIAYVFATNEEVRKSFSDLIGTLGNGLLPILSELANGVISALSEALTSLWNNVLVPLGNLIGDVLSPLLLIISDALSLLFEEIVIPLADALGTVLLTALESVVDVFGFLTEKITPVIETLQFLWNGVLLPIANYLWTGFKPVFEKVFKTIGEVIENLGLALSGLINFVTGVFTGDWEKAWNGVKDIFKGIFNGLISIVEFAINNIIDGLNKFISGFNGIVTKIGDVIGIDIEIPVIHNISLPRFEHGGYPETGQLFLARENGLNEMVGRIGNRSAVANNDQIVQAITAGVANGINSEEQNALLREQNELLRALLAKDTDIQLDGRSLVSGIDTAKKRMGYNFRPQPT